MAAGRGKRKAGGSRGGAREQRLYGANESHQARESQESQESLWLAQLMAEYLSICRERNLSLQPPVFALSGTSRQLGRWEKSRRCITMSRNLILEHPWGFTLQVLRHEMAHQLCSEQYGSDGEPHGPLFQRCCEALGVLPQFRRASGVTEEMLLAVGQVADTPGRRCIEKVKKLFALGESANEHEAALAIRKANELLLKYRLGDLLAAESAIGSEKNSTGGRDQASRYTVKTISLGKKTIVAYQSAIFSLLQRFFFVRCVVSTEYDPHRLDSFRAVQLLGTAENLAVAEYCYHYLEERLAALWERDRQGFQGGTRRNRNSYYLGMVQGFTEKMAAQESQLESARRTEQETVDTYTGLGELIRLDDERLDDFVALNHPYLRRASRRSVTINRDVYGAGFSEGKRLNLHQPVSGGKGEPIKRLR